MKTVHTVAHLPLLKFQIALCVKVLPLPYKAVSAFQGPLQPPPQGLVCNRHVAPGLRQHRWPAASALPPPARGAQLHTEAWFRLDASPMITR